MSAEWAVRAGRRVGSSPFAAITVGALVLATVSTHRQGGDRALAVLAVVFVGVVLTELSLLCRLLVHADRTAAELAFHQLESDKHMAAEILELADNEARLAVELARLNARLRASEQHPGPIQGEGA